MCKLLAAEKSPWGWKSSDGGGWDLCTRQHHCALLGFTGMHSGVRWGVFWGGLVCTGLSCGVLRCTGVCPGVHRWAKVGCRSPPMNRCTTPGGLLPCIKTLALASILGGKWQSGVSENTVHHHVPKQHRYQSVSSTRGSPSSLASWVSFGCKLG